MSPAFTTTLSVLWCLLIVACVAGGEEKDPPPGKTAPEIERSAPESDRQPEPEGPPRPEDPSDGEVRLPAGEGWNASLVIDNGETGIWTVDSFQIFPQLACPEVVGLDDKGRCLVLESYSGRWKVRPIIQDHKWLGGLAHGDIDPRIAGNELYTGGQRGNLFQVVAYGDGALDCRRIAHLRGREIHTIVVGELDPRTPSKDLIVFTRPGGLYRITPTGRDGTFETTHLADLSGRVRDALVLPGTSDIATVARTGKLEILRLTAEGPQWTTLYEAPMGMGRLALRRSAPVVLYTSHDDGRILRHERLAAAEWRTETIYRGPLGPRGVAAGRFHEDPKVETVAIFGYSGKLEVLSRNADGWHAETIFVDRHKGHWLAAAELDGRNGTHELLSSGYSGRVVLLSRPPGYGVAVKDE
ncbi:MAG: hypothetical protein ACYTGK_06975 [Planctomycetota bacterium]|jgi:hypothetical protein